MITKRDVKEKRKYLATNATKKVQFNKGDKRVFSPRVCVVCGRPLSSLVIRENRYVATHPHTRYHINEIMVMDACKDINSCYRTLNKKGELVENVNGE